MNAQPKLQDIPGLFDGPIFRPGDRIIAQVANNLHRFEREKLERSIEKFACCPVRILIVNPYECRILLIRNGETLRLLDPDLPGVPTLPGIMNVSCRKFEFHADDRLVVYLPDPFQRPVSLVAKADIRHWVGRAAEVQFRDLAGWKVLPCPGT